MRNLKKILALVLALVMSLSLMATAGAADFSDKDEITDKYSTAIEVLNGLEVFQGYDNGATFKPQGDITRAEVAAIIYRIATGDVSDTQKDIYSSWGLFTDVADGSWYAGYVNYCANAGYIKGRGNKIFDPNGKVTGYEALAMILRAIGYDKNNEFSGSNWQVRTASIAKERHITDNITDTLLGQSATREVVAEILFQAILVPTVTFSTNTLSYTNNSTSLGYDVLKLEEIEGIVIANEYANLNDIKVLADGKTNLNVDGNIRSLDYGSEMEDMGESRLAYIVGSKVLALGDTGKNESTYYNEEGTGKSIGSRSSFNNVSGLTQNDDTEFYVNFGREGHFSSEYRIEFSVTFEAANGKTVAQVKKDFEDKYVDGKVLENAVDASSNPGVGMSASRTGNTYSKIIRAEENISADELNVIRGIFAAADNANGNYLYEGITGDVYAGTRSSNVNGSRYDDLSDEMSYRTFYRDYILSEAWDINFSSSDNGEWLKIVDNDADGEAEYAFRVDFVLDKAVSSYTKNGETILEFNSVDVEDLEDDGYNIVIADDIAVGDIVLYTEIDKQILMEKAEMETITINAMSFKDKTVTSTDGTVYKQSGIENETLLDQDITTMEQGIAYNVYFDAYGFIRAFEPANGNNYGLLTELYYSRTQNTQYVTNAVLTAELKAGAAAIDEYDVENRLNNPFLLDIDSNRNNLEYWNDAKMPSIYKADSRAQNIVLQPATAHLDTNEQGRTVPAIFEGAMTNVAKYVETEDGTIRISSPVTYATNKAGARLYYTDSTHDAKDTLGTGRSGDSTQPVYAVDYIELNLAAGVAADARQYPIARTDYNYRVTTDNVNYVNAVNDTQYYIVDRVNKNVTYFEGFSALEAIAGANIYAAYAVASNTDADNTARDYWIADVIVIEVSRYAQVYDSIALAYYNPSQSVAMSIDRQSGRVQLFDTLNNKAEGKEVQMLPKNSWGSQFIDGYGFYGVIGTEMDGDILTPDRIEPITSYNSNRIYAGTVARLNGVNERGDYLVVTTSTGGATMNLPISSAGLFAIGTRNGANNGVATTEVLHPANVETRSDIKVGDQVMWVQTGSGSVEFLVDVSYTNGTWQAPAWLKTLYDTIWVQQNSAATTAITNMLLKGVSVDITNRTGLVNLTKTIAEGSNSVAQITTTGNVNAVYVFGRDTTDTPLTYVLTNTGTGTGTKIWTTSDATALTYDTTKRMTWTVVLVPATGNNVEYTITVTMGTGLTGTALSNIYVKGQPVNPTGRPTTNSDHVYNVTLTAAQADSTTTKIITGNLSRGASVTQLTKNGSIVTPLPTPWDSDTAKVANGDKFVVTVTAENGDTATYTFNITVSAGVTVVNSDTTYAIRQDTTGSTSFVNGGSVRATTGSAFTFVLDDGRSIIKSARWTSNNGQSGNVTVTADGKGIIPANAMTAGATVTITNIERTVVGVSFKAAGSGVVRVNGTQINNFTNGYAVDLRSTNTITITVPSNLAVTTSPFIQLTNSDNAQTMVTYTINSAALTAGTEYTITVANP